MILHIPNSVTGVYIRIKLLGSYIGDIPHKNITGKIYTVLLAKYSYNFCERLPVGDKILSPSKSALYGRTTCTFNRNVLNGSTRTR